MQITRLIHILLLLLNQKKTTAKILAEKFNVSPRTIYRDIDAISLAGIPVYSVKGKNGGIFLDNNFHIDQTLIDEESQQDVLIGLSILRSSGLLESNHLFDKLDQIYNWSDWLEIDFNTEKNVSEAAFQVIRKAIFHGKQIQFVHHNSYGQTRLVVASPLKIVYRNQNWYVLAVEVGNTQSEFFLLQRIRKVILLEEKVQSTAAPAMIQTDSIIATLRFSKRVAYKKYADFWQEEKQENPDGSFDLTREFLDIQALIAFVLPYGKNVEILKPEWAKIKAANLANEFFKKNS